MSLAIADAPDRCAKSGPDAAIDAQPVEVLQIRVALLCAKVLLFDAFDSRSLGFEGLPLATRQCGAVIAGPAADEARRDKARIAGVMEFDLDTLVTTRAHSLEFPAIIRLDVGFGSLPLRLPRPYDRGKPVRHSSPALRRLFSWAP